jgi:hypothetical protein
VTFVAAGLQHEGGSKTHKLRVEMLLMSFLCVYLAGREQAAQVAFGDLAAGGDRISPHALAQEGAQAPRLGQRQSTHMQSVPFIVIHINSSEG